MSLTTGFVFGFVVTYLLLIIVGAWRFSHDFATEEGPGGLYGHIRRGVKAWIEWQIDNTEIEQPRDHPLYWLYDGIDCPHCISWGAALFFLLVATSPLTWPLALWWGVAGCITLLDKVTTR